MAGRAKNSTWLEVLTRAGFVGYGLLHLAVAWLAIQIAVNHSSTSADQAGAFRLLEKQPLGRVLLVILAIGLAAMALWQLLLAAVGHREFTGRRRAAERIASAGRVVIYAFLSWTCIKVAGGSSTSSASSQEKATAGILAHPWGQWLVGLAGLVVLGIGIGMIVYGARKSFAPKLKLAQMGSARRSVLRLGQFGYIAKGIAFGIAGGLLLYAATSDNASRSTGLDGALRTLAAQPFGTFLLFIVAIGFVAFGVYCFFQARFRKV